MKIILITAFLMLSFTVSADLHKCVINGKTAYTEKQCPTPESEKAITKGTASTLDTSAIRQQMAEDEMKKKQAEILQERMQELKNAEIAQKQAAKKERSVTITNCTTVYKNTNCISVKR